MTFTSRSRMALVTAASSSSNIGGTIVLRSLGTVQRDDRGGAVEADVDRFVGHSASQVVRFVAAKDVVLEMSHAFAPVRAHNAAGNSVGPSLRRISMWGRERYVGPG